VSGLHAYAEVAFEPWVVPEAVRLTEQRSRAQERRAELALTAQGGAAVVAELEALVREHPVREESWRLLALALYDAGQGDALAALRRGPGGAHRRAGPERRQRRSVCAVVSLARHMEPDDAPSIQQSLERHDRAATPRACRFGLGA
jgi:cytochrome c-type biogenesis protein CcmH/NrfG